MPLPKSRDPNQWTEAELDSALREASKDAGWIRYHTYRSVRSPAGFPDLVLVRPPEILFVELKSAKGKLTAEQETWLASLRACGLEVYVWRPADYEDALRRLLSRRVATRVPQSQASRAFASD